MKCLLPGQVGQAVSVAGLPGPVSVCEMLVFTWISKVTAVVTAMLPCPTSSCNVLVFTWVSKVAAVTTPV